jgi:serine/threonine protein phosphatase PrpC
MASDVGVACVRGVGPERGGRERNEDSYLVCSDGTAVLLDHDVILRDDAAGEGLLIAVFDGMGGHDSGQDASAMASRAVRDLYRPTVPRDVGRAMRRYVQEAHKRLYWSVKGEGPVAMGTTLTACWVIESRASWTSVGDSRLYLFRDGAVKQVSSDHTAHQFARRDGMPETGPNHLVQSFIFGSRGLGDNTSLRLEQGLDAGTFSLERGDRLLLCTDGVWASIDDAQIGEVLRNPGTAGQAAAALVERAIARGSTDNLTALVVDIHDVPDPSDPTAWTEDDDQDTYAL